MISITIILHPHYHDHHLQPHHHRTVLINTIILTIIISTKIISNIIIIIIIVIGALRSSPPAPKHLVRLSLSALPPYTVDSPLRLYNIGVVLCRLSTAALWRAAQPQRAVGLSTRQLLVPLLGTVPSARGEQKQEYFYVVNSFSHPFEQCKRRGGWCNIMAVSPRGNSISRHGSA